MSDDREYNGWTNRNTWLVNLWIDNDEGPQGYFLEAVDEALAEFSDPDTDKLTEDGRPGAIQYVADVIERWVDEQYEQVPNGLMRDMLDMDGIDYEEIAEHMIDAAIEELA